MITRRHDGRTHGFTLVELLLSLALMAALLTALAAAMQAAMHSSRDNDRMAEMTQVGRSVLARISDDVRAAADVDTSTTSITITPPPNAQNVTQIMYQFQAAALTCCQTTAAGTQTYTLIGAADDVRMTAMTVTREDGTDADKNPCTKSVFVHAAFESGGIPLILTASVSPRRSQEF